MNQIKLKQVRVATNLLQRGVGVIGWKNFDNLNGLLLPGTNSIHTFFVRFPLDLVFLDKDQKVIHLVRNLKPFRFSPIVWQAKAVLEMPEGSVEKYSIKLHDEIKFV